LLPQSKRAVIESRRCMCNKKGNPSFFQQRRISGC
jgi:hypothetical protein